MNRSGEALLRFPESRAAGPSRHLVVLDDVYLPFGRTRFRTQGRDGGHRGLASILAALGTTGVPRLRLGVGGAPPGRDLADHVLEDFTEGEEAEIPPWLARASEGVRVFLTEGPDVAMSRFNG
jgi:PTH1 family peptidyl-tRNA hydrolase